MALKTTRGKDGRSGLAADAPVKGRGAASNLEGRFERVAREAVDDGWDSTQIPSEDDEALPPLQTQVSREVAKSIISRNTSPDIPFEQSINPYRGCEHGCVYCLAGDTPILVADGTWKPLADIHVGDELYGTERRGFYREYVRTRVLAHWRTRKPAYKISLNDGTEIVASGDHRFLTERGWKHVAASTDGTQRPYLTLNNKLMGFGVAGVTDPMPDTGEYRRGYLSGMIRGDGHLAVYRYFREGRSHGDQHQFRLALIDAEGLSRTSDYLREFGVATNGFQFVAQSENRRAMDAIRTHARSSVAAIQGLITWPAGESTEWMRGFVAGIFDAEGSFSDGTIRIGNTDQRIVDATTDALGAFGFETIVEIVRPDSPKPVRNVRVRGGLREHLRFMGLFNPAIARKRYVEGQKVKSTADLRVAAVEPLNRTMDLFDITTGTGDFVANGVISHNCYARPSHAYLGLSPGLDFETRLVAKVNAADLLRTELAAPSYVCKSIALGANTDPYQPIEREWKITRSILDVLVECDHPFSIVTKNALVERDIDLIAAAAAKNLVHVYVSITNLDPALARTLEPRASAPYRRIEAIKRLTAAGIPVGVLAAPMIPFVTDSHLEEVLERAAEAGATSAGYILLRLPYEVAPLFKEWLAVHYPLKADHVMSLVRQTRGGKDYDANFAHRHRGTGQYAELLAKRFALATKRLGLNPDRTPPTAKLFKKPARDGQMGLF